MANAQAEAKKVPFLDVTQKGRVLTFTLADGQALTIDAEAVPIAIAEQATMHGLNQKIRDAAAGFSKGKDYDGAFEAMQKVIEALERGDWNRQGGSSMKGQGILAEAIARIKNVSVEQATGAVAKATDDQKKAWAKNPSVAAIMAQIVAERAQARLEANQDEELDIEI